MENKYLHGYTDSEQQRLLQQAQILSNYIYPTFDFKGITNVLELGCGSGGQTLELLKRYPHLHITSLDISSEQINKAQMNLQNYPEFAHRVDFVVGEASSLIGQQEFEGIFICWVLEHTLQPIQILQNCQKLLIDGGQLYITEVYNRSFDYSPRIASFDHYFTAYNQLQYKLGGNPNIGIELGNLLNEAGFSSVLLKPSVNLHDANDLEVCHLMFEYWYNLMLSAEHQLRENGFLTEDDLFAFKADYAALYEAKNPYFYYCAMQAIASK
jgi:2-polyprenyl-3-methyl-5-hydroxy-6-metoxy-1,4-benzoquinol methylase